MKTDLGIISTEPMPGAELDLALLAGLVTVMATRVGRVSVDAVAGLDPTGAKAVTARFSSLRRDVAG